MMRTGFGEVTEEQQKIYEEHKSRLNRFYQAKLKVIEPRTNRKSLKSIHFMINTNKTGWVVDENG